MSAGVPLATKVVVLWAAEGVGAPLMNFTVSLGLMKRWFSNLQIGLLLQMVGWDRRRTNCKELEAALLQN